MRVSAVLSQPLPCFQVALALPNRCVPYPPAPHSFVYRLRVRRRTAASTLPTIPPTLPTTWRLRCRTVAYRAAGYHVAFAVASRCLTCCDCGCVARYTMALVVHLATIPYVAMVRVRLRGRPVAYHNHPACPPLYTVCACAAVPSPFRCRRCHPPTHHVAARRGGVGAAQRRRIRRGRG